MDNQSGIYEVALSYAGEQREYVRQVAERLQAAQVSVFFDDFEQANLWGQDLAVHFDTVYRTGARFVVPFVSKEYASKVWPQHEFKSALAKAVEAKATYILPVRFDHTDLPGLRPTIHYLDATQPSPGEVAVAILSKLGKGAVPKTEPPPLAERRPKLVPSGFNPYAEGERALQHLRDELPRRAHELEGRGFGVHAQDRGGRFTLRIMRSGEPIYGLDIWIGGEWGDNTICFATGTRGMGTSGGINAHGAIEWDRDRGLPVVKLQNLSLLPQMAHEYRLTPEELADEIWNALCLHLEQDYR